jgi:hypothetical protein
MLHEHQNGKLLSSLQFWMALGRALTLDLILLRLPNREFDLSFIQFSEI